MKKAIFAIYFLLFTAAIAPSDPPLRHDFDTALPADENTGWTLLNYRLLEPFNITARQLVRKTPIDRTAELTVERYLERPEDGTLIHLGMFRSPYDGQPLHIPISYFATHWLIISDGANTAVKRVVFYDREHALLETAYMEETQQQHYPIASKQ